MTQAEFNENVFSSGLLSKDQCISILKSISSRVRDGSDFDSNASDDEFDDDDHQDDYDDPVNYPDYFGDDFGLDSNEYPDYDDDYLDYFD